MSFQPTITGPASSSSAVLDRANALTLYVNLQLSRPGEYWWGYTKWRYRTIGSPTWTYVPSGATATSTDYIDEQEYNPPLSTYNYAAHVFAGSTFAAGDYEAQAQTFTFDSSGNLTSGTSAQWSPSFLFSMGTPPAAPTITAPSAGATVARTATVTYTNAAGQVSQQVQVVNGAVVEYDSGETAISGTSQSTTATFPTNSVTRTLQVRTKSSGGLWSAWATRSVNVSYTPPATPTLASVSAVDAASLGVLHAVTFTVTHPTPSGGQPAVVTSDVYARLVGDSSNGIRVGVDLPKLLGSATHVWSGPTPGAWQIRVVDKAADGTSTTSAWATVSGTVAIRGVVLHDPAAPSTTALLLRFNNDELVETRTVEQALVAVAGREFPLAEFGASGARSYDAALINSKGVTGVTDASKARALMERRVVLCYRDRRERRMYGQLSVGSIKDTIYGSEFSVHMDQVYADLTPPSDVL